MHKVKWVVIYVDISKRKISAFPISETCTSTFSESLEEATKFYNQIINSVNCEKAYLINVL